MTTGLQLLDAGVAADKAMRIVGGAATAARDLTLAEAQELVRQATRLQCAALSLEREALGIPAPRTSRD